MPSKRLFAAAALVVAAAFPASGQETPRAGQAYGDWVFACMAISETRSSCVLRQTLLSEAGGRPLAQLMIARGGDAPLVLRARLPLRLDLRRGVTLSLEDGNALTMTLINCAPNGCLAITPLDSAAIEALENADTASIWFVGVAGRQIRLPMSTDGLVEGLTATGWGN